MEKVLVHSENMEQAVILSENISGVLGHSENEGKAFRTIKNISKVLQNV